MVLPLRPFFKKRRSFKRNSLIMRHYEVTFIVDPVLSGDEVKATAQHVQDDIAKLGGTISFVNEMGLRQMAYPINKRSSGVYFCVEFTCDAADWIGKFELNMKRNEQLLRFLTVKLDRYGVKYNDDKRNGRIGTRKKVVEVAATDVEGAPVPEVIDLDNAPATEA
jgi:small subunit ribosomal protein S6